MSIGKLISFFSLFTKLPVYAEDVRDQIVELGVQDQIHFEPLNVPPERLLGMFVRSRGRNAPYAEHLNVSTIFYNVNVSPDEQNFICCKELMHVFDKKLTSGVRNEAELAQLLSHLFRDTIPEGEVSISGFLDEAATFMALAIMFPHEIRPEFLAMHASGRMSEDDIARELGISRTFVPQLLTPQWEVVRNMLAGL